ncbi:MAG: lamin tail domain-containing protein [Thermoplasmata archaeon]
MQIQKDEKARVSFAVMGVLMLILGSFSAIYLTTVNTDHVVDRIEESHVERMRNMVSLIHEEVETQAYYRAMSAVYTATQVLHDQKQIMPFFNETFNDLIDESFPRTENQYIIVVESFSAGVFFEVLNTHDIVPTNEQENQSLTGKDEVVESKTMSNDKAGEFNETSGITYYTLSGEMNYTIRDTKSARFLRKSMHLERRVESAYPLLNNKLEVLDAGAKGTSSPIPRTVKYILTTLAQYRVLQGYGLSPTASKALGLPNKSTSQILTSGDVELALNLALLLETARLYRTYDDDALMAMDENFHNQEDEDYDNTGNSKMQKLVREYVNNGTVDPADIIALYFGIDSKSINIEAIIAQALNAIADKFILKYLDYFHLMDAMNVVFFGVQILADAIDKAGKFVGDLIGFLTGRSEDEENLKRIKNWVRKTLTEEADLPDTKVMHDIITNVDGNTYTITLTKSGECWNWEDVDNDPSTPDEYVKHTWSTTVDYEIEIQSGNYTVDFIEKDILRSGVSKLWYDPDTDSDFYDQQFGTNVNQIYATLREAIKGIIAEVLNVMSNIVDLDISSYKYLSRPENLNPKDDVSLLEEIRDKVDGAVETIKSYFSGEEGEDRVKNLIVQLVNEHARAIGELQTFIVQNFDDFADKDANIKLAEKRLAQNAIFNGIVTKISQDNGTDYPDCAPSEPFSDLEVKMKFEDAKKEAVEKDLNPYVAQAYENVKIEELLVENDGKDQRPLYIIGGLQNIIDGTRDIIVDLITSTVNGFGLIPMACDLVKHVADEIIFDSEMANTKFLQYTKLGVPFEFWDNEYGIAREEGRIDYEILKVDQEPDYLSDKKDLEIEISKPKGTHYTSVAGGNIAMDSAISANSKSNTRPFVTNWDVTISGGVELKVRTESRLFLGEGTHDYTRANMTLDLDISITVTVYSGWDLYRVNYELSNTFLGDIISFLTQVWDYIVSVVGAVFDALTKLIESFMDLLTKLISYVAEIVKLIMDTIQFFVRLLQDFIQFIVDSIIKPIIEVVANVVKEGLSITLFGFTFAIKGNKEVAENSSADGDLLWVSTSGNIACVDMSFKLRFARYHKADDDEAHYDVLLDGKIKIGDFDLEISVDPLMKINSHIVEGHGKSVSEEDSGWGLDFYMPDIEEYKEVKWSLSDVMGGLNSIPIPFLGLKATIDAGFVIRYNAPKGNTVVINEFELNPEGDDGGNEWFEIYNPVGWDLRDWRISTAHGGILRHKLSDLESENDGDYTIYTLPKEALNNGKTMDPFSPGDGLILINENGDVVDRTPMFKDPGEGDEKTWQRSYDGSVIWKLKESTRQEQNGPEKFDIKTEIMDALKTSFNLAWTEFIGKDLSLDAIIEFIQDWIQNFIDMVITLIQDVVQKVYVFLDIALEDVSGSTGGGIRISLGMDGDGIVALLRWLVETIETFFYNICNPSNPKDYPSIPKALPEHMFIRFELYFEIGTPKIIQRISTEPPPECRLSIAVQANIPALVALLGWDWGDWEVIFGVFLARYPSKAVSKIFGTSEDPNTYVDIWLFKARIYEIS